METLWGGEREDFRCTPMDAVGRGKLEEGSLGASDWLGSTFDFCI